VTGLVATDTRGSTPYWYAYARRIRQRLLQQPCAWTVVYIVRTEYLLFTRQSLRVSVPYRYLYARGQRLDGSLHQTVNEVSTSEYNNIYIYRKILLFFLIPIIRWYKLVPVFFLIEEGTKGLERDRRQKQRR